MYETVIKIFLFRKIFVSRLHAPGIDLDQVKKKSVAIQWPHLVPQQTQRLCTERGSST